MKSYRCYNPESPMSDIGHAMFADSLEGLEKFGDTLYTVDSADLVDISKIIYSFYTGEFQRNHMIVFPQVLNPEHIAISAEFWDIPTAVSWFINSIAKPNGIKGIKTKDGAVVFDSSIIKREE